MRNVKSEFIDKNVSIKPRLHLIQWCGEQHINSPAVDEVQAIVGEVQIALIDELWGNAVDDFWELVKNTVPVGEGKLSSCYFNLRRKPFSQTMKRTGGGVKKRQPMNNLLNQCHENKLANGDQSINLIHELTSLWEKAIKSDSE